MLLKTENHQYFFEVQLKLLEGGNAILSAKNTPDMIKVAATPEFAGGAPGKWSAEQLFLASLSSSLMETYFAFAAKVKLRVVDFECTAIGQVRLVKSHMEFTIVNLFPKILIAHEEDHVSANKVLMKTYKHAIISNSVKTQIVHHGEVLVQKGVLP